MMLGSSEIRYDREALVDVLIYHQRADAQYCACGWGELGKSFADHQADVYEQMVQAEASSIPSERTV